MGRIRRANYRVAGDLVRGIDRGEAKWGIWRGIMTAVWIPIARLLVSNDAGRRV